MSDKVLLIDDEPHILSALQRDLADQPFTLCTSSNPAQALRMIDEQEFALIVSDNVMPDGSGLDLLSAAGDRWRFTRRILLTGATNPEDAIVAFNAGTIHRFLNKPWHRDELIQALNQEAATYRKNREEHEKQIALENLSKAKTRKIIEVVDELKQSQTQVSLIEDTLHPDKITVPPKIAALNLWVVDENDGVRNALVGALRKVGISRCVGIPSPVDALWRVQNGQSVQVILSEWRMNPIDGLMLMQRIRELKTPGARAKFILVTGREQRPLVKFALDSQVDGYMIKPFHLQALIDHIDFLLNRDLGNLSSLEQRLSSLVCLIVNHHLASCDQLRVLLSTAGIKTVFVAHSWQLATRLLSEHQVDVVIHDLNVPELPWRSVVRELAIMPRSPAILLTSVLPTEEETREMAVKDAPEFIPGPIRQAELVRAVAKVGGLLGSTRST